MPPATITIDPDLSARASAITEKQGQDLDSFTASALKVVIRLYEAGITVSEAPAPGTATVSDSEDATDDITAVREGIRRGLEAEAAGRVRSFAEFAAEQRTRYNLP